MTSLPMAIMSQPPYLYNGDNYAGILYRAAVKTEEVVYVKHIGKILHKILSGDGIIIIVKLSSPQQW